VVRSCWLCSTSFAAAGFDDVGAVGQAVDDGFGEPGVGEDFRPLAEGEVGGDDQ
jgi:hypothetical protein